MTFDSLVDDIETYSERSSDTAFVAQVPRFIMLAESDLAAKWRGLGNQRWVTDFFTVNQPILAKPARWRETISWGYGINAVDGEPGDERRYILERSLEYCRSYWPNSTLSGTDTPPVYYGNYDWNHFLVVPTPAVMYPFELGYWERIQPLDDANQTNWLTEHAPQLLLSACMLQAQPYLKWFGERLQSWATMYQDAIQSLGLEARNQTVDRSTVVDKQ